MSKIISFKKVDNDVIRTVVETKDETVNVQTELVNMKEYKADLEANLLIIDKAIKDIEKF